MPRFPRSTSRRARPSWADHVPHRQVRIPGPPLMARRSAVAVLTASALLGGGVYAATAAGSPVTVLGLTGTGDCDEQLAASSATRAQARALLTDLIVSDDPDAHALAGKISEIGFAPASQPDGWRQHAVDTSDQLHRLGSTDPQVQQLGVRLAAAGLGPTPADLLPDRSPGAAQSQTTAPPSPVACTATDTPAPITAPRTTTHNTPDSADAQVRSILPTTAPAATPTSTPPVDSDPDSEAGPGTGAVEASATRTTTSPRTPSTAPASTPAAPSAQSAHGREAPVRTQTAVEDAAAARAAVGMVSDLMQTITAAGDAEATQVGLSVLAALDRDHLESLGADPADLDILDRLRTTTSGSSSSSGRLVGNTTTDPTGPTGLIDPDTADITSSAGAQDRSTSTPRAGQLSPSDSGAAAGTEIGAGEPITRTDSTDSVSPAPVAASSRPARAGTRSSSSGASDLESSIEKLTGQARAAAEVDPAAQGLLDALTDADLASIDSTDLDDADLEGTSVDESAPETRNETTSERRSAGGARRAGDPNTAVTSTTEQGSSTESASSSGESGEQSRPQDGAAAGSVDGATWDELAQCESSGNWSTDSGNGYHGGLQFSPSTWKAFGGSGAAHEASRAEQIAVAERVQATQGWQAWPACSKRLGLR